MKGGGVGMWPPKIVACKNYSIVFIYQSYIPTTSVLSFIKLKCIPNKARVGIPLKECTISFTSCISNLNNINFLLK